MNKLVLFVFVVVGIGLSSCNYDFIEPMPSDIDPTDTLSFQNDIVPIFTANDKCASCHETGGTSPDLTADNAYNSITSNGLVVDGDAEGSIIYYYPAPQSSEHSWSKYTEDEAALVKVWIEQGALNN